MRHRAKAELVDARAKLVIRIGVAGTGLIVMLSGALLLFPSPESQLWLSWVLGPVLLVYGALQTLAPFRRAKAAEVIRLDDFRKRA